ncbi:hypothetical protein [Ferrimonas kyonanensis]|uniref:hypothetical protein n=1 Tax=Ferrimonas kyonanensis TaxID=364763 RepID=UPI0003FE17A1|nr:hypothetical protein [Ferrimonas kyonanensis]
MIIIMSSAFVASELQSEFGPLPPAFLPVGNRRLYEYQIERLCTSEKVVISLPEGYEVAQFDSKRLEEAGVEILFLPQGLSLGEAVLYAVNLLAFSEAECLRILHGDTLLEQFPSEDDIVALSEVSDAYDWAVYKGEDKELLGPIDPNQETVRTWVANGYFSFSNSRELVRALTESRFNFVDAINIYHYRVGLRPERVAGWFDFGHVHTYFRSKSNMTTQRAFNQMSITASSVTKRSQKSDKMLAETKWYEDLPSKLKVYSPQLLNKIDDENGIGYEIEYLHLTALNELFTFGELPPFVWRKIIRSCLDFLDACKKEKSPDDIEAATLNSLFGTKSKIRLANFSDSSKLSLCKKWKANGKYLPSLNDILINVEPLLPKDCQQSTWYHGDFCLSNILYDFRTGRVKVIDPRGISPEGVIVPYGDIRYDLAKLSHSIIGRYDFIIAGNFDLDWEPYNITFKIHETNRINIIENYFVKLIEQRYGLERKCLIAMQIHLFLSMLPLHSDNSLRQKALLCNALRLYSILEL